jgi:NADPH:quinone reductase-like Zn-dependent oxidoreductase
MIDHRTMAFEARARQITGGPAVELILDAIGGDSLKKGYPRRRAGSGYLAFRRGPPTRSATTTIPKVK